MTVLLFRRGPIWVASVLDGGTVVRRLIGGTRNNALRRGGNYCLQKWGRGFYVEEPIG